MFRVVVLTVRMTSLFVRGSDGMEKFVHGRVGQSVPHQPAFPLGGDPAPIAQQAQRMGNGGPGHFESRRQVGDADPGRMMQAQQQPQAVDVGQQFEAIRPLPDVGRPESGGCPAHIVGVEGRVNRHAPSVRSLTLP